MEEDSRPDIERILQYEKDEVSGRVEGWNLMGRWGRGEGSGAEWGAEANSCVQVNL